MRQDRGWMSASDKLFFFFIRILLFLLNLGE